MTRWSRRAILGGIIGGTGGAMGLTERARAQSGRRKWPSFACDTQNTGATPARPPETSPAIEWTAEVNGAVLSTAAIADERVIVGDETGVLHALNALSGERLWTFDTADRIRSTPTVRNGTVVVGSDDGTLYGLSTTGEHYWEFETEGPIVASPALVDGTVYAGSYDGTVYAIDVTNGDPVWMTETGGLIASSAAVADDTVYLGSSDQQMYALDAATGESVWQTEVEAEIAASPAVSGGTVFINTGSGETYAFDARSGNQRWSFEMDGMAGTSPAVMDGTVYLSEGLTGTRVHAVSVTTGTHRWTVNTEAAVQGSPAVGGKTMYIGTGDGQLYAIGTSNGQVRWTINLDGPIQAGPALVNGGVIVGTTDATVYALGNEQFMSVPGGPGLPGGVGALITAGLGVGGGTWWWWRQRGRSSSTDTSKQSQSDSAGSSTTSGSEAAADITPTEIPDEMTDHPKIPETVPAPAKRSLEYRSFQTKTQIGSGGNADVYRTTTADGAELAVKEPHVTGTIHTETVEQLLEEAETWGQLDDHDHIVKIVDYGSDPVPWIAMEYMDGGTLTQRAGNMGDRQALWTAIAVTKAVRHAHRRGVAHLDLKPANILFRSVKDRWDVPKVADWGLSKHLFEHSHSIEGLSPQYAAPEQFDQDRGVADNVTDIYQLGAVLYELFTGRPPFEGRPTEIMQSVLATEPQPPSSLVEGDLPPALDDILMKALATSKGDRYDDIVYLRDDLRDLY